MQLSLDLSKGIDVISHLLNQDKTGWKMCSHKCLKFTLKNVIRRELFSANQIAVSEFCDGDTAVASYKIRKLSRVLILQINVLLKSLFVSQTVSEIFGYWKICHHVQLTKKIVFKNVCVCKRKWKGFYKLPF